MNALSSTYLPVLIAFMSANLLLHIDFVDSLYSIVLFYLLNELSK